MQKLRARKLWRPCWQGRDVIVSIQQALLAESLDVPLAKLCRWFGVARRTMYYRPVKTPPKVRAELAEPEKALIEQEPSFGYRTVSRLLGMNKNTVRHLFQLKGWQVRKRPIGQRPRIEALPSVAQTPDERWSTDLCRIWGGRDGWLTLAIAMDCHIRAQNDVRLLERIRQLHNVSQQTYSRPW